MVNTAFLYDYRDVEVNKIKYKIKDYFSYDYGDIADLVRENFSYFEYIKINNNDRLEILSYDRYGTENYADLLVMINAANFSWMLPYDKDIQISIADAYAGYLTIEINGTGNPDKDSFIQTASTERASRENSEKQQILVPKKQNVQDVINLIASYKK